MYVVHYVVNCNLYCLFTENAVQSILAHYQVQVNVSVKVKLVHLLGQLALTPGFDAVLLLEDLLSLLASTG